MNNFNGIGNLGKDAEVRFTQSGIPITSFSVAITSGWGDRKATTWVNCSLWGKKDGTEHGLTPYLLKGVKVGITGEICLREYETQAGKGSSLDCKLTNLTLCGDKGASQAPPAPAPKAEPVAPAIDDDFNDDVPF